MDIYNRSAERTVIEMNLAGIAIIIVESFQTVFDSDMLSMLGNIFPLLSAFAASPPESRFRCPKYKC